MASDGTVYVLGVRGNGMPHDELSVQGSGTLHWTWTVDRVAAEFDFAETVRGRIGTVADVALVEVRWPTYGLEWTDDAIVRLLTRLVEDDGLLQMPIESPNRLLARANLYRS